MNTNLKHLYFVIPILLIICVVEFYIDRWESKAEYTFLGTGEAIWEKRYKEVRDLIEPADILFIGDSTVTKAIDAELFYRLCGKKALNLGLTGDYVSYGDYAVLKKYLKYHSPPKAIVVWHTDEVWPRSLDKQLFAFTEPEFSETQLAFKNALVDITNPSEYIKWPIEYFAQLFRNKLMIIPSYRHRIMIRKKINQYIPVLTDMNFNNNPKLAAPQEKLKIQLQSVINMNFFISEDMKYWFERLIDLANENNIEMFAAHSPIHELFIRNDLSRKKINYIDSKVNAFFNHYREIKKLNYAKPIFIDGHTNGDKDHASEAGRIYLTMLYANLMTKKGIPH